MLTQLRFHFLESENSFPVGCHVENFQHKLKDGSTMMIEAAKGGHTQVVKLLLEYLNRMLMNTQQDLPQVTANDSHLVESRVPIHGLANIVPPSEPDSHPAKPNNLTTCEHTETTGVKRKASVAEMNIPIKPNDQILQNMQKSLAKKSTGTGNSQQADNKSNKNINVPNSSNGKWRITGYHVGRNHRFESN